MQLYVVALLFCIGFLLKAIDDAFDEGLFNRNAAIGCWIFAAVACGLGLTGTRLALWLYIPWMGIAFVMGNVISRLLVALFYYLVITPMGLMMRVTGRDRLRLKKRDCKSYWVDKKPGGGKSSYERQF